MSAIVGNHNVHLANQISDGRKINPMNGLTVCQCETAPLMRVDVFECLRPSVSLLRVET